MSKLQGVQSVGVRSVRVRSVGVWSVRVRSVVARSMMARSVVTRSVRVARSVVARKVVVRGMVARSVVVRNVVVWSMGVVQSVGVIHLQDPELKSRGQICFDDAHPLRIRSRSWGGEGTIVMQKCIKSRPKIPSL